MMKYSGIYPGARTVFLITNRHFLGKSAHNGCSVLHNYNIYQSQEEFKRTAVIKVEKVIRREFAKEQIDGGEAGFPWFNRLCPGRYPALDNFLLFLNALRCMGHPPGGAFASPSFFSLSTLPRKFRDHPSGSFFRRLP